MYSCLLNDDESVEFKYMRRKITQHIAAFTLLECLITLAIIAIIVAIAYPNYRESICYTRRKAAHATLQDISNQLTRHYAINRTYRGFDINKSTSADKLTSDYYHYEIEKISDESYQIAAVPQHAQLQDVCGALHIDDKGLSWANNHYAQC